METLFQRISESSIWWAYWILFMSAYIENVFPPIPGDTVTVIGAYFVGSGKLNFWGVYLSTTIGSVLGFLTLFLLAYWLEWRVIERYQPRWMEKSHLDRVERWFHKYGYSIILANRFLSGVRSVISLFAGLSKLNIFKVTLFATVSCLVWNGLLIYLGAFIGKNWDEVASFIKLYNKVILALLIGAGFAYLIYYLVFKRIRSGKK